MHVRLLRLKASWIVVLFCAIGNEGAASAQSYTWSQGASTNDWLTAGNWTPSTVPGASGLTSNANVALFGTVGNLATASGLNSGYSLGAIATTGTTGGLMTVTFNGNNTIRLNGGYTVGSFNNVAAAAQNGRNLLINTVNMTFGFGTAGQATTFFADAGRILTISSQSMTNYGTALNKEGSGVLILSGNTISFQSSAAININAGTFTTSASNFDNVSRINVAGGAALQAGLLPNGSMSFSGPIDFATNSKLRIATNGSSVSQLQNAAITKGTNDAFNIVLTGLNPSGTQSFNPNGIFIQASSLTGFDPNGTYTKTNPGHFSITGDGFTVMDWNLTVLNGSQVRLNSMTISPVPEPVGMLAVGGIGLAAIRLLRRRKTIHISGQEVPQSC